MEHIYYLLPLCVHVAMPFIKVPQEVKNILEGPLPGPIKQMEAFGWLLGPLMIFAFGSYCIDSRNSMCFFPGTPYFYRVIQCNLKDKDETDEPSSHDPRADMKTIRDWALQHDVAEDKSSHFWFRDLVGDAREAFDRCAHSSKINKMFRSLFGERHYCLDILPDMNEIYITGPARVDEVMNSDHVFYSRHVDGPFGFVPFCSVYRCIVGLDRNMMVSVSFLRRLTMMCHFVTPFLACLSCISFRRSRRISLWRISDRMLAKVTCSPSISTARCTTSRAMNRREVSQTSSA